MGLTNDLHARERHIAEVFVKQGLTQLAAVTGLNGRRAARRRVRVPATGTIDLGARR
jgi:hypothetical protein